MFSTLYLRECSWDRFVGVWLGEGSPDYSMWTSFQDYNRSLYSSLYSGLRCLVSWFLVSPHFNIDFQFVCQSTLFTWFTDPLHRLWSPRRSSLGCCTSSQSFISYPGLSKVKIVRRPYIVCSGLLEWYHNVRSTSWFGVKSFNSYVVLVDLLTHFVSPETG